MKKLVLLRHGESQWNLENRFTGWTNVDLTQKGEKEARKAGELLNQEGIEFDCHYSVDFSRTDHAKVASSYGIKTWTVKKPNELKKIISEAVKYKKGTCLIDIFSQPLEEAKAPVSEWIA